MKVCANIPIYISAGKSGALALFRVGIIIPRDVNFFAFPQGRECPENPPNGCLCVWHPRCVGIGSNGLAKGLEHMSVQGISNTTTHQVSSPPQAKAALVARQFEALFASMVLKSMRRSVRREDGLFPPALGERIYSQMLDDEYGHILARHGNLGISDMLLRDIGSETGGSEGLLQLQNLRSASWMIDRRFVPSSSRSPDSESLLRSVARWERHIQDASRAFGVDSSLIKAVIACESAGNPNAVSSAGAKGLMQLIDDTAREVGVSRVFDPRENIMGGTRYLRTLLDRFEDNETLALASYNAGPGAVQRYGGVPPYRETERYVENVRLVRRHVLQSGSSVEEE